MKKLSAFYFSGTGNTRYVTERLCEKIKSYQASVYDISEKNDFAAAMRGADCILLAYPIYGSSPPVPMRRFVYRNAKYINGRDVIIVITQYMFSGDGAASLGRTVEKLGGRVIFAEHFDMPNNLADCRIFTIRNVGELRNRLEKTERRIDSFADRIDNGKPVRRGFNALSHAVGYCCQRKFWRRGENAKKSALKIDGGRCVGCGLCEKRCPVGNISVSDGKAVPLGNCALCYRCINACPKQAITLFGKNPPQKQYKGVNRSK